MNRLRELLSLHSGMSSADRLWLLAAALVAVCLLSFYVNLLHEQVASGAKFRQALSGASNQAVTRLAALPTPLASTQARHATGSEDHQTR